MSILKETKMLAKLTQTDAPLGATALERATHALMVLPFAKKLDGLRDVPALDRLRAALKRRDMKAGDLAKTPVSVNLADGGLCSFVMLDGGKSAFERQNGNFLHLGRWRAQGGVLRDRRAAVAYV